jgi:CubicO group peptidase (beta-lactamase class C family)
MEKRRAYSRTAASLARSRPERARFAITPIAQRPIPEGTLMTASPPRATPRAPAPKRAASASRGNDLDRQGQGGVRLRGVLFALALIAGGALAAPDEAVLGKGEGYPVCPLPAGPTEQRCLVGMYSHYDRIVPARKVARGAAARELKRAPREPDVVDLNAFLATSRNTGLLLLKGDTILAERYQYDRQPEHRFTSMSMAKTVVAMLVGIAIEEGSIKSVDDRAEQYVAELKVHPYGETPIRHLLTMSSGVKFREDYDGTDDVTVLARATLYGQGPGCAATVMPFKIRERAPGERFSYASAETQVLGLVLRAAVGKSLAEYLSEKIWQPMGAEADATWLVDKGGCEMGYLGLQATLRDWGRLGMLLANGGELDGRQIVPAAWVKAATTPESAHLRPGTATRFNGYGYQTWVVPGVRTTFALFGVRGQAVFVDPAAKLVLVHTAVHAQPRDPPARGSQFSLWNALLRSYGN